MTDGAVEAGGTKWVLAVGRGPDDLDATTSFPTTSPDETLAAAADFLTAHGPLDAVGVGCFGPIDVRRGSPTWGRITTTPKPGWSNVDVAGPLAAAAGAPVAFETDVAAAALGEGRWGAAQGLSTFSYVTVGTGIGAGIVANGEIVHGLVHPELGHVRVPHDLARDPFPGACPYHGDCLEGLASGPAIEARWGRRLDGEDELRLEADYLAHGLVNLVCTLSPERIVVGGGVAKTPGLLALVQERVRELLAGYVEAPEIVPPALGDRAGVLGALALAQGL